MPIRRRSSAPTVLGILSLIGGCLGLLLSLIGILQTLNNAAAFGPPNANAAANPIDAASMEAFLVANVSGYHVIEYGGMMLGLTLDVLLIVSGVGLLYYKKWARRLAIVYALLSIVSKVALGVHQFFVLIPAITTFIDKALPAGPMAPMAGFVKGVLYFRAFLPHILIVYPIVLFSILLSKSGKEVFEPPPPEEEYEDDYDHRPRRLDIRRRGGRFDDRDDRDRW